VERELWKAIGFVNVLNNASDSLKKKCTSKKCTPKKCTQCTPKKCTSTVKKVHLSCQKKCTSAMDLDHREDAMRMANLPKMEVALK
jgi:hypothetical protein